MQLGYRLKELQTDRIVIFLAYLTTDWHALTLSALQGSETCFCTTGTDNNICVQTVELASELEEYFKSLSAIISQIVHEVSTVPHPVLTNTFSVL